MLVPSYCQLKEHPFNLTQVSSATSGNCTQTCVQLVQLVRK
jgi:hypothetical protein